MITQRVNGHATNEVMTQQWSKYVHLTSNAKWNLVEWKTRYATTWDAKILIPFQIPMQSFLYESLNTTLIHAIQCKYLLKSISKMQLRVQLLCIFQYKRMKNENKSHIKLSVSAASIKHKPSKTRGQKKSNALMEKQKG